MATCITRAELCSGNGAVLLGKYRARLLKSAEVPAVSDMSWMEGEEVVVIDDLPGPESEISLVTSNNKENTLQAYKEESSLNSSKLGGSPLKYEFLTLSKLQAQEGRKASLSVYEYSLAVKQFVCTPLRAAEARCLAGKLVTNSVLFDMKPIPSFWIVCDTTDFLHTSLFGLCRTSTGTATYQVKAFHRNYPSLIKSLEDYTERFYDSYKTYANTAYCVYDVIPKMGRTDGDSEGRVSGFLELYVSWKFSDIGSGGLLTKPPPSASVTAKISPGWLDMRMPLVELADELELVLALGHALRTGEMAWPSLDPDQICADEKFLKSALRSLLSRTSTFSGNEKLKATEGIEVPRDFTEELWVVLRHCRSNQSLTNSLSFVFDALKSGYKNTMVLANNKSTMARLLRDACANELFLPRLEGLTPVQICLEMGLERLRRVCMDEFLNKGYFETVAEINAVFDCRIKKDPQDQVDALFLLYNSLLVMNTFTQFFRLDRHNMNITARQILGQYNKLDISATSEDVNEKVIEKMNFTLNSGLSFADVFKPVHECKIPKIWKSEVKVEMSNTQGWIARCMILCSRTTQLPFIKNLSVKEVPVLAEKQPSAGEDSLDQLDSSKEITSQSMPKIFLSEKPISRLTDGEKQELDAALRHYYVTVVTGSYNKLFIKCQE